MGERYRNHQWAITSLEGNFKRGWKMVEGSISVTAERAVYKGIQPIASTELEVLW